MSEALKTNYLGVFPTEERVKRKYAFDQKIDSGLNIQHSIVGWA